MQSIYLDNNATTQLLPEVAEAMREAHAAGYANPASQHEPGRRARRVLEDCRDRIGELLGCRTAGGDADRVVFTSGGTEANNLAVYGLARASRERDPAAPNRGDGQPGHILISAIEHPSVAAAAAQLATAGWTVDALPVDQEGVVRADSLPDRFRPDTRLVSVMLGNNETGVLQPVQAVAAAFRRAGVLCHTDAVQAVGKVPVSFRDLNVDALTCTAHKLHGPPGIGALVLRSRVPLAPLMQGGFQQAGLRPGTETVALAVGFRQALESWHSEQAARMSRLTGLRDRFEAAILAEFPEAVVIGKCSPRLPHTSQIAFVGLDRQALQMALDLAGVACSTGSACASGSSEPSTVLLAMGCDEPVLQSSLRFSLGALTTAADVEAALERILLTCRRLRRQ